MKISEIFYSLQGEGKLAGMPSVFIRLAGCPLRCKWCDTKFAWYDSAGTDYSVQQIKQHIAQYPTRHIVITGGEPVTNDTFGEFLNDLVEPDMHITIETSGIKFLADLPCDLMSISPKLANSNPTDAKSSAEHEKLRFNLQALQKLIDNYDYQLKFVIDKPAELDEVAQCLGKLENINPYKIYLMPQATEKDEYIEKSKMLAEFCKNTGFALSPRLQVLLWPNKRGK